MKTLKLANLVALFGFAALAVQPASATDWKFYLKGAAGNPTNVTCITDGNWILQSGNSSALDATKPIIIGANNSLCVKAGSGVLDLRDLTIDGVVRQIHIGGWQGQSTYVFNNAGTITEFYADNVAYLGASTFNSCKNLTTVSISGTFDKVPGSCFNICSSLTNMVLNSSNLTSIGASAFQECKKLVAIEITTEKAVTVANTAVQYCYGALTSLKIDGPVWTTANMDNLLSGHTASTGTKKCTIYADSEKWSSLASAVTTEEKAVQPKNCFGVYREGSRKAWFVPIKEPAGAFLIIVR